MIDMMALQTRMVDGLQEYSHLMALRLSSSGARCPKPPYPCGLAAHLDAGRGRCAGRGGGAVIDPRFH